MKSKKETNDILYLLMGIPVSFIGIGWLFTLSYCSVKQNEKDRNYLDNNIIIKEATLLDTKTVKSNSEDIKYTILTLDTNKNGILDDEDEGVKTTQILPLEKNKNIIYFETKKGNEKGVIAYQDKDNNYRENNKEIFFKSKSKTAKIFEKLPEYMANNKQR